MKSKPPLDTVEVFRRLGLETEEARQRILILANLGHTTSVERPATIAAADTRNNTLREVDDAQLEPAS